MLSQVISFLTVEEELEEIYHISNVKIIQHEDRSTYIDIECRHTCSYRTIVPGRKIRL